MINLNEGKKEVKAWKWRATTKPGQIFVHIFEWPDGSLVLPAIAEKVVAVSLLSGPGQLEFEQSAGSVKVMLPSSAPDEMATVVRIKLDVPTP